MVINRIAIMFLIISILFTAMINVCYINNFCAEPTDFELFRLLSMPSIILWLINLSKKKFKHKNFQIFANSIAGILIVAFVCFYFVVYLFFLMAVNFHVHSLDDSEVTIKKEIISEPNFATYIFKGKRIPKKRIRAK